MNVIVLGPPGSGKGTQAKKIAQHFQLTHVSSGQLLRAKAQEDTPKGKAIKEYLDTGELVPLDTVLALVDEALLNAKNGFVLDGTPRNLPQAEHLDWFFTQNNLQLDHVILLEIPDEEAIKRLLKRAQIEGRSDDNEITIRERFRIYHDDTQPVIDHYQKQGKLIRIDGRPDIETITTDILSRLK
jgi:adenylate kinase